MSSVG